MRALMRFPKIACDCAEIKVKGDTTPMIGLVVVDSSTGVDQKGGSSRFAAKMDCQVVGLHRQFMNEKVQCDAGRSSIY